MRSQQQADREEQQRIKNLVLNYEASNEPEPTESENDPPENPNRKDFPLRQTKAATQEKRTPASQRTDKAGANRSAFRSRKLQLSDVNW